MVHLFFSLFLFLLSSFLSFTSLFLPSSSSFLLFLPPPDLCPLLLLSFIFTSSQAHSTSKPHAACSLPASRTQPRRGGAFEQQCSVRIGVSQNFRQYHLFFLAITFRPTRLFFSGKFPEIFKNFHNPIDNKTEAPCTACV